MVNRRRAADVCRDRDGELMAWVGMARSGSGKPSQRSPAVTETRFCGSVVRHLSLFDTRKAGYTNTSCTQITQKPFRKPYLKVCMLQIYEILKIYACEVHASEIREVLPCKIHEVLACKVHACEVHTCEVRVNEYANEEVVGRTLST